MQFKMNCMYLEWNLHIYTENAYQNAIARRSTNYTNAVLITD